MQDTRLTDFQVGAKRWILIAISLTNAEETSKHKFFLSYFMSRPRNNLNQKRAGKRQQNSLSGLDLCMCKFKVVEVRSFKLGKTFGKLMIQWWCMGKVENKLINNEHIFSLEKNMSLAVLNKNCDFFSLFLYFLIND